MNFPFIHFVFPVERVFDDLRASYKNLVGQLEHAGVAVHGPEGDDSIPESPEGDVFVCYSRPSLKSLKRPRQGKVLFVYCEPLTMSGMSGDGLAYLRAFEDIWPLIDGALVHTPQMKEDLVKHLREVEIDRRANYGDIAAHIGVFPAGLDPTLFTLPSAVTERDIDFLFYGSPAGKRQWSLPSLKKRLGDRLVIAPMNTFGDEMTALLHRTKVSVYVAHSDVRSYSTWRMWRDSLAGAAMAIECLDGVSADAWPMFADVHYLPMPKLENTVESYDEFVKMLNLFSARTYNMEHSANDKARRFSTEHCVQEYLLPFIETLETK